MNSLDIRSRAARLIIAATALFTLARPVVADVGSAVIELYADDMVKGVIIREERSWTMFVVAVVDDGWTRGVGFAESLCGILKKHDAPGVIKAVDAAALSFRRKEETLWLKRCM